MSFALKKGQSALYKKNMEQSWWIIENFYTFIQFCDKY